MTLQGDTRSGGDLVMGAEAACRGWPCDVDMSSTLCAVLCAGGAAWPDCSSAGDLVSIVSLRPETAKSSAGDLVMDMWLRLGRGGVAGGDLTI